jgi:membrane-bound lytic murein transglycosylase F
MNFQAPSLHLSGNPGRGRAHTPWVLSLLVLLFGGCSPGEDEAAPSQAKAPPPELKAPKNYVETGDLEALKDRGKLRILAQRFESEDESLPRQVSPLHAEQTIAQGFAEAQGLKPVMVYVDGVGELIPALVEGRGDVIATNLTITESRKEQVGYSVPVHFVREQLVGSEGQARVENLKALAGKTVGAQPSTSFWETLQGIKEKVSGMKLEALPEDLTTDEILDMVSAGAIDYTVEDSNVITATLAYRDDIAVLRDLTGERPVAWAVRPDSPDLLAALNRYLNAHHLTNLDQPVMLGDLDAIKKRGVLRMLTRNSGATYFLWRGQLLGFEYEMAKRFAERQGVRLEVVVPPSHEELIPWLIEGRGDFIAAFLRPTQDRIAQGVSFSRHYHYTREMLVARNDDRIDSPDDLAGREIVVRRTSSYWDSIRRLQEQGLEVELREAPEDMETPEIIDLVGQGDFDLTVADSHILDLELTARDDVKGAFPVTDPVAAGWVVRGGDTQLLGAIEGYFRKEYRGTVYNLTFQKYFENKRKILELREERVDLNPNGSLSPYDDIVRKYTEQYGFDWRMVIAQMYQESRFDPKAKSWAGAKGLMQVLPSTAAEFGFKKGELADPDTGIHAGVKYLDWIRDRFDAELPVTDRMWFTLASYNAGYGHVRDARRLAGQKGWDRNRWFDNVERAMLLLSNPKYYRKAAHGFVRGTEPVAYVQQIAERYRAYVRIMEASNENPSDIDPLASTTPVAASR